MGKQVEQKVIRKIKYRTLTLREKDKNSKVGGIVFLLPVFAIIQGNWDFCFKYILFIFWIYLIVHKFMDLKSPFVLLPDSFLVYKTATL